MAQVVEVNCIEELEHYYLIWNSLFRETRGATFFQSFDWLRAYWRHYGDRQKLKVLVVYSGGSPIGIVPLTVITERTRVGEVRTLTYPLHDWSSFYGPIGPNPTATLAAAMRYLRDSRRDWDLLDLRWTNRDDGDHGRTQQAMHNAGFQGVEGVWDETAVIETSCGWDGYFASRTSRFRNNVRRAEKRIAELGELTFERYRPRGEAVGDGDPRWDVYEECVALARRSWQGSSETGTTISHESVAEFFRETHELAAKAGTLDLVLVRLNGKLVAFCYNYHRDGRVFGLRVGIDPDVAAHGMGTVLYAWIIRDSCGRGDQVFDMGPGSLDKKRRWITRVAKVYRYTHYPLAAPRVQILRLKRWLKGRDATAGPKIMAKKSAN